MTDAPTVLMDATLAALERSDCDHPTVEPDPNVSERVRCAECGATWRPEDCYTCGLDAPAEGSIHCMTCGTAMAGEDADDRAVSYRQEN